MCSRTSTDMACHLNANDTTTNLSVPSPPSYDASQLHSFPFPRPNFQFLGTMSLFYARITTTLLALLGLSAALPQPMTISTAAQQPATQLCGTDDSIVLTDTPWIIYNMFYNSAQTSGTQCTNYDHISTDTDGTQHIVWSSVTNIDYVGSTYVRLPAAAPTPPPPKSPTHADASPVPTSPKPTPSSA